MHNFSITINTIDHSLTEVIREAQSASRAPRTYARTHDHALRTPTSSDSCVAGNADAHAYIVFASYANSRTRTIDGLPRLTVDRENAKPKPCRRRRQVPSGSREGLPPLRGVEATSSPPTGAPVSLPSRSPIPLPPSASRPPLFFSLSYLPFTCCQLARALTIRGDDSRCSTAIRDPQPTSMARVDVSNTRARDRRGCGRILRRTKVDRSLIFILYISFSRKDNDDNDVCPFLEKDLFCTM